MIFTISIQGSGNLRSQFHQALMARHPGAKVYDQKQETDWQQTSPILPPSHQEVADIDVFFNLSGNTDHITLRCRGQHRFFSFDPDKPQNDEVRLERLLQAVVDAVVQLLAGTSVQAESDRPV